MYYEMVSKSDTSLGLILEMYFELIGPACPASLYLFRHVFLFSSDSPRLQTRFLGCEMYLGNTELVGECTEDVRGLVLGTIVSIRSVSVI